nr:hypothetical protein [Tanacetum cinerariifolium]
PPRPIRSLGYRAAMIPLRDEAASTSHLPPLQLPSASRREDKPEVTLPPRKRLDNALGPRYEVGESSSAAAARPSGGFRVDYGFGAPVSTDMELGRYVREFETRVRQDTDEIYMRRAYAYTRHLMETEARMSREAWVRATDASDLVYGEVMSLCTTVLGQMPEIRELQAADRMRQTVILELLRIDHMRSKEISELRTALQGQGLAGDPTQLELPEEAGDDGDDEEESSEDEEDNEMDVEADEEEEEEEHPAPADSVVVALTAADQAPSAEETEPFETDELLAISSPPASPLSPWSSPPPRIPFPPLPPILSPPSPVLSPAPPPSPIRSLGYRAAMIRLRDEAASTSSPPSQLPSASHREDRPEVTLPPWKRLDITLGPRYELGESSSAAAARPAGGFRADYGFVATGAPVSTDTELGGYVREFETRVRQDTDEIYMRLDDGQTERQLLAGRLNMLFRDRRAHAYTRQLMETEARMSREAWVRAIDASDLVHGEVMSLRTTVLGQMSEIRELHAADHKR